MMGQLKRFFRATRKLANLAALGLANVVPRVACTNGVRIVPLRMAGMKIASGVVIWGPLTAVPLQGLCNISIGQRSFLNTETRFGCPSAQIRIGSDMQIGPRVCFETVNHGPARAESQRGALHGAITVGDKVWIGCGAIILPGSTLGVGSTVGAGAVVTSDVAPFSTVGGVPARVIIAESQ